MDLIGIESIRKTYQNKDPKDILLWAWETFGEGIAATSSFQSQSLPMLHMISQSAPKLPVLFLDTGFHFPDTLKFRDNIVKTFKLNLKIIKPEIDQTGFKSRYGDLYRNDPDLCCYINKVKPLQTTLKDLNAWITGIRADQTASRENTPWLQRTKNNKYKISPLIKWTNRDIWQYIDDHQFPTHPLLSQGYLSIGCAPCTRPVFDNEDERAGRWPGISKDECGIHVPLEEDKYS